MATAVMFDKGQRVADATEKGRGEGVILNPIENMDSPVMPPVTYAVQWDEEGVETHVSPDELRPA
ncbi:MAG: hypothetical protein K2W96_23930 [Gemmataceae bacterium]|nr:hypothetical protein [Gemmataceae bacterium]